jgi:hypothetical protein
VIHVAKRWQWVLAVVVVLALVAAACGGGGEDASEAAFAATTTTSAAAEAMSETSADLEGAVRAPGPAEAPDELGAGGIALDPGQVIALNRDIIYTADLVVAVTDVTAAGVEASRVVASVGGFLFGQQTTGAPEPRSVLIFKVPPENFQETLALLGSIGEVRTQTITADDVTERVVDLESRIKTSEASVERLQALLAEATDIKTIANVESQLLQRETDLETLRGQLRTIQDRVNLATITLTLTEALADPQIGLKVTAYPGSDDAGSSCPGNNGISVEKGETATLCFKVTNPGDTPLTDFTITDTVLGIETGDLVVVVGNPAGTLQPGQSFIMALEVEVDQTVRTRTRVEATPVNQEGEPIEGRTVAATTQTGIQAVDPGGLPGFADGLEAAWEMLAWLGGVIVLFAGLLLPFVWVPIVLWLVWRWRRTRRRDQASAQITAEAEKEPVGDDPPAATAPAKPTEATEPPEPVKATEPE